MIQPNPQVPAVPPETARHAYAAPPGVAAVPQPPAPQSPDTSAYSPAAYAPAHALPTEAGYVPRTIGQRRGAWAVWWLSLLTFGIYYLVWYYKINKELALFAPHAVRVNPALAVLAQLVPIVGLVSLANTAGRVKAAHASIGSPVHASGGTTVLAAFWFASHTRYLQRRLNALWDAAATLHVHGR